MNEKEFNGLILAELVKIANEVFTNEIEIAPGTYTAAELAKLKDANGNEINIKYLCVDAKLNITDFRAVQINSFKCSFPVDQVFNLVWQFEKLIGTKQANKTRFTKIEERENIVCSFDMWITKEHLNITKLVTKDSLRPAFNYIYLDPYKSALVASDGRTLKEYPVIIETSGLLPDGLKLFINPKHLKEMVGRCSVCVCSQEGGNITKFAGTFQIGCGYTFSLCVCQVKSYSAAAFHVDSYVQCTILILAVQVGSDADILNAFLVACIQIAVTSYARVAEEVLIFQITAVAPAEYLESNHVFTRFQVVGQVELGFQFAVLAISYVTSVHPKVHVGSYRAEMCKNLFAFPVSRKDDFFALRAYVVVFCRH